MGPETSLLENTDVLDHVDLDTIAISDGIWSIYGDLCHHYLP